MTDFIEILRCVENGKQRIFLHKAGTRDIYQEQNDEKFFYCNMDSILEHTNPDAMKTLEAKTIHEYCTNLGV